VDAFDLDTVPTVFSLRRKHKELKDSLMDGNDEKLYFHGQMGTSVKVFTDLLQRVAKEEKF